MKKWLKWGSIVVLALIALLAAAVLFGKHRGEHKLQRKIEVPTETVTLSADPARLEVGRYLFNSRGCAECPTAPTAAGIRWSSRATCW